MTLPKNIPRLVDDYRQAVEEDYSDGLGGTASPRTMAVRAALEAAIAAAIQPVEPPTDAEVEAWERLRERVQKTIDVTPRSALLGMLLTVRDWIDEERGAGR